MGSGELAHVLRRRSNQLFLIVLFAVVWLAYAPSLKQSPRADQWCYLLDTHDCHELGELLRASYSYSRTRKMFPMDTELFRPVLFILLALEKVTFQNNFDAVQAVGIVLHCVNLTLLFTLLVRLRHRVARPGKLPSLPGWFPHAVTFFFALNNCTQELVLWGHLHGYLLFVALVLGTLLCVVELLLAPDLTPRRQRWLLVLTWSLIFLSAFTYELGQFFALIVAAVLCLAHLQQKRLRLAIGLFAAFASIALIYQGVNQLDKGLHAGSFTPETVRQRLLERLCTRDSARHAKRFLTYTAAQPFFPSTVKPVLSWAHRLFVPEMKWSERAASGPRILFLLSCIVGVIAIGMTIRGGWEIVRRGSFRIRLVVWLFALNFVTYSAMIVTGRMNFFPGNKAVLAWNSYYTYLALIYFLPLMYFMWLQVGNSWSARGGYRLMGLGLMILGGIGGFSVRASAWDCRKVTRPFYAVNERLRAFVAAHWDEADFSFTIAVDHSETPLLVHGVPMPILFYARWIDNHHPRYVLLMRPRSLDVLSLEEYRQRFPDTDRQINPDIVELSSRYHIYSQEGVYYALPSARGWLDRKHRDDPELLKADTLAELRQLIPPPTVDPVSRHVESSERNGTRRARSAPKTARRG
jgi:hypothetical protein